MPSRHAARHKRQDPDDGPCRLRRMQTPSDRHTPCRTQGRRFHDDRRRRGQGMATPRTAPACGHRPTPQVHDRRSGQVRQRSGRHAPAPLRVARLLRWMRKGPNHLRALPVFPVSRAGETVSRSGNSVSRPVKTESRPVFPDSRPAGHEGATRLPPHSSGRHERTPTTGDFRFAQTGNYGRAMRDASPGRNVKRKKNYPYLRAA